MADREPRGDTPEPPPAGQAHAVLSETEGFGDDLRHVDWKVWARQDRLTVKQFEEDTNLRCLLLVDTSRVDTRNRTIDDAGLLHT